MRAGSPRLFVHGLARALRACCHRCAPLMLRVLLGLAAGVFAGQALAVGYANGRFAYTFDGKEFPDARSACAALLTKDRDVPQTVSRAGPAQENGGSFNVPCTGKLPDGSIGYDQEGTAVGYELICPEKSREEHPDGVAVRSTQRCACDQGFEARGNQCVIPGSPAPATVPATAAGSGETAGQSQRPSAQGRGTGVEERPPSDSHSVDLLKKLAPKGSQVRLVATLKLAAGASALKLVKATSTIENREEIDPATSRAVKLQVSKLPLSAAQTRAGQANSGGYYIVPSPAAQFIEVVTWNTKDPKDDTNSSHAEEQLASWLLEHQRALRAQLADMSIEISHSPCAICTERTLCPLMQKLRQERPELTASLTFDKLHTGRNPTRPEDLYKLRDQCHWRVVQAGKPTKPTKARK